MRSESLSWNRAWRRGSPGAPGGSGQRPGSAPGAGRSRAARVGVLTGSQLWEPTNPVALSRSPVPHPSNPAKPQPQGPPSTQGGRPAITPRTADAPPPSAPVLRGGGDSQRTRRSMKTPPGSLRAHLGSRAGQGDSVENPPYQNTGLGPGRITAKDVTCELRAWKGGSPQA